MGDATPEGLCSPGASPLVTVNSLSWHEFTLRVSRTDHEGVGSSSSLVVVIMAVALFACGRSTGADDSGG